MGALLQAPQQKKEAKMKSSSHIYFLPRSQKEFPELGHCFPTSAPCYHPQRLIRQQPHPHQRSNQFLYKDHQEQELEHSVHSEVLHRWNRGETLPSLRTSSSLHCYLSETPLHYLYRELPDGLLSVKANIACFSRKIKNRQNRPFSTEASQATPSPQNALYARESVSAPRGVDVVTHGKDTGCAAHCTLTDPVMTLFSSSVGRAHLFWRNTRHPRSVG